jgi:hypothetical protein
MDGIKLIELHLFYLKKNIGSETKGAWTPPGVGGKPGICSNPGFLKKQIKIKKREIYDILIPTIKYF